jgi:hypothetical protein
MACAGSTAILRSFYKKLQADFILPCYSLFVEKVMNKKERGIYYEKSIRNLACSFNHGGNIQRLHHSVCHIGGRLAGKTCDRTDAQRGKPQRGYPA